MKNKMVSALMVPLSEYATVPEEANLLDAVMALEKSQQEFTKSRYPHRAILVLDAGGAIVGKISQLDVMRALEPLYDELKEKEGFSHSGLRKNIIQSMVTTFNLWNKPFDDVCRRGAERKVNDFMHKLVETEYVNADDTLDLAIHQFITGSHQSLLVMRQGVAAGILRLTDVFTFLADMMKQCQP